MKVALDAMAADSPVLKLLVTIVDFLRKLWTGSNTLNKLFSTGLALWQRMVDFFTWLLDAIKSGVQFIKDGLGITKAEAKEKYRKAVEMAGGIEYFNEEGKVGWYDRQGNAVPEENVPGYLSRAQKEYQNAPASVIEGLWNWLMGIFERLIGAIKGLPGTISAAIRSWFPGAGGSDDKDRSPAETQADLGVEAKAQGAYVKAPNDTKLAPSQWPMQYLFDKSGEFGSKPVYGPGGAELGTVEDFMTKDAAMDALLQAAKAGGKPSDIPGISFSEDTWLDLLKGSRQSYPAMQELYDRLASGSEGAEIKADRFGNEYLAPTAPETFKNQGKMYVAFGENGLFDVWNASGLVKSGFGSEEEADEYIKTHSLARGGQIQATGSLIGHGGEEVDPARVVVGGKTTLARINELFSGATSSMGGPSITVQAPPVNINIGRIEKDVDVDRLFAQAGEEFDRKLLFRLRNSLNSMGLRDIGYLRG